MASFHSSCLSRSVKGRITVQKRLTRARKANSLSVEETRTLLYLGIFSEKIKKCIICLQITFYATIQPYIVYEYSNVERGQEHGIEGTDLNFEFKMASLGNVVFIDRRIMDVAFLISLTHKNFSSVSEQVSLLSLYCDNLVVHFVWFIVYSHRWP